MSLFSEFKKFIFDTTFPIECLGCGREGEWLCGACLNKINPDHHSLRGEFLDRIFTFYLYDNEILKRAIHGLKYRFVEDLAPSLGKIFVSEIKKVKEQIGKPDFVGPIPLHKKRLLERGFNQSELLSLEISKELGWPFQGMALGRSRMTTPQASLGEAERKINICGAFAVIDSEKILDKKIVLVDDVFTTGATMEECARILKDGGAKEVVGLALAKG